MNLKYSDYGLNVTTTTWTTTTSGNTGSNISTVFYPTWEYYNNAGTSVLNGIWAGIKDGGNMKNLYNVLVVSKAGAILLDVKIVAEDREEALFLAEVNECLKAAKVSIKNATVLCNSLGSVKCEEEIKRVKVIKE